MNLFDILLAKKLCGGGSKLGTKSITANGTYSAASDNLDGYSDVTVNVTTDPTKGVVFSDWDADGYPLTARIIGFTEIPDRYLQAGQKNFHSQIETIYIPEGTQAIKLLAFTLPSLKTVNFPSSIVRIANNAFEGTAVQNVYIPNANPLTLGGYCFRNCSNLKRLEVLGELSRIEYTLMNEKDIVEEIVIGGQITTWINPFNSNTESGSVRLYDFSGCNAVFALSAVTDLPHASGCIIRVKQSLLSTWQQETNWSGLTNVVWQGV